MSEFDFDNRTLEDGASFMGRRFFLSCSGLVLFAAMLATTAADTLQISDAEALSAGKRLWQNECNGTVEGLTSWNAGEAFASLGIGHYIWYPAGQRGPFEESFPELIRYLSASGVALPEWIRAATVCPWGSREEFVRDQHGHRLTELRGLLARTVAEQAHFSANRLETALPKMLAELSGEKREAVRRRFYRVAASPGGIYALVDYVNFKGEGTLPTERYHDQGWGLLQVLGHMNDGNSATADFSVAAAQVLGERVANSPPERREARWLPGWKNRVATYRSGS